MAVVCPKCNKGEMRSHSTHFSKRLQCLTRKRICNSCGYAYKSCEVDYELYRKNYDMVLGLQCLLEKYNKEHELPKSENVDNTA